jgi:hypothetical protein
MSSATIDDALDHIAAQLRRLKVPFAVVGGLGVSVRAEVRFTRDVDIAIAVDDDAAVEHLARELAVVGYRVVALVEHDERKRVATVRLASPSGFVVDLLTASSGVEREIVAGAGATSFERAGDVPVARAEHLLAMKVLSVTDQRLQDRIDARNLLVMNPELDVELVRGCLREIALRGFHRGQDLQAKLDALLEDAAGEASK